MGIHKVSLSLPRDLREKIDAERARMSQCVGADLSFNQSAIALLRKALADVDAKGEK